jgi:hypothetical protein
MTKRIGPPLLALALACMSLPAFAQAESTANIDEARQRFMRGAELFKEGSFDAALAEFTRAYQIAPNYRVLYNMAQVQMERHDYAAAMRLYQDYLSQGGSELDPERREQVNSELAQLKNRVSKLVVKSNVAGAELSVDGAVVGTLPLADAVLVSSGVRRLSLRKTGYTPVERTLTVVGGDKAEVELLLEAPKTTPVRAVTPSSEVESSRASSGNPGLWVSLVATGVFAGTAVGFGLVTRSANKDLDADLARYPANPAQIDDDRSRLKLWAGLTDGFAGAAVFSALVTTYFALSGSGSEPAAPKKEARTRFVGVGNGVGQSCWRALRVRRAQARLRAPGWARQERALPASLARQPEAPCAGHVHRGDHASRGPSSA